MRIPVVAVSTLFAFILAACGGGGGGAAPPVIRFEVRYEPAGLPQNATVPGRYLTVRALPGSTSLGTRPTARVELVVDKEAPTALTAPSFTDAQGRQNYVFPVSAAYEANFVFRACTTFLPFTVTVTDADGMTFTKFARFCPGQELSAGAFSDYGDRTVRYSADSTGPMRMEFRRFAGDPAANGYLDEGGSPVPVMSSTATLRAREGDELRATGVFDQSAADGAGLTVGVDGQGGSFARSALSKKTGTGMMFADATLVCCRLAATPESSTSTRTVSFVVSAAQLGPVVGPNPPVVSFDVHYRLYDPGSGRTLAEFQGTAAGYESWTFQVKNGDQLTLEASPRAADTYVDLWVSYGTGVGLESPSIAPLATSRSNRPGVPGSINVFCCSR